MNLTEKLLNKNAQAISAIAKDFIITPIGSKIKTISDFESIINVSRGTIQNSIKTLNELKAVTLNSRGTLGTYMVQKDENMLLKLAGINYVIGVMPLPYSRLYEGISTGILETMSHSLDIPINMAYMRGASSRIEMIVNNRYDFAIVSKYAALTYLKDNDDIKIVHEFPEQSYLTNHVLMLRKGEDLDTFTKAKIGIDFTSIDQADITKEIIKNMDVELVPISYNQIIEKLNSKEIDAAVWNGDELKYPLSNIDSKPIPVKEKLNTIAVVIIKKDRHELEYIIKNKMNIDQVIKIQADVLSGDKIPSY